MLEQPCSRRIAACQHWRLHPAIQEIRLCVVNTGVFNMYYEVFDPTDGVPIYRMRWRWVAKIVAKMTGNDWALEGDGWIPDA